MSIEPRPPSGAAIEEATIRLLRSRLDRFSRWATPVPAIQWKLGECAETRAAVRLFGLLFRAARESSPDAGVKELARRVLDAYDQILVRLVEYRTGMVDEGANTGRHVVRNDRLALALRQRLLGHLKKLRRARPKDWAGLLVKMLANPDNEPKLLTALWQAATSLRLLRARRAGKRRIIEVRIEGRWKSAGTEPWYLRLTTESEHFGSILDKAISAVTSRKDGLDIQRRLREIAKRPTAKRLRNLFDDLAQRSKNEAAVARYRFRVAGRTTGIFPNGLPADFIDRLADRRDQIRALVQAVLGQIKRTAETRGRPEDKAIKAYADRVAAAYKQMTGKTISYARGTGNVRPHLRNKTYGLGAEIMTAALKLVDSSMDMTQAQAQLDRIKKPRRTTR